MLPQPQLPAQTPSFEVRIEATAATVTGLQRRTWQLLGFGFVVALVGVSALAFRSQHAESPFSPVKSKFSEGTAVAFSPIVVRARAIGLGTVTPSKSGIPGRHGLQSLAAENGVQQSDEAKDESFSVSEKGYQDPTTLTFRKLRYFFGQVKVGLGPGMKPMDLELEASFADDTSGVAAVRLAFPMGLVFEESEAVPGRFEVIEVGEGSNAEKAGIKKGDLIRTTTARAINKLGQAENNMAYSASGGGMMPTYQMALFNADNQPFEELMRALVSNSEDKGGPGEATLVIERNKPLEISTETQTNIM